MSVDDRRPSLLGDLSGRMPAGGEGERRHRHGRRTQLHVGPKRIGITEHVQGRQRRVVEEVKIDAAFVRGSSDERMPRRDDVHFVATRGDPLCNRFHERAHGIARKPWVGRRHQDDGVAHMFRMRARGTALRLLFVVGERLADPVAQPKREA